ncbi:MAG TPA: hypothetical protein VGR07_13270, partial [Thermoanaerobaculia bacterium]|nr:hypothetical protein [Thermoanaerobaculia bacterium]
MSKRTLRRAPAALALALTLTWTLPAAAAGRTTRTASPDPWQRAWQWLEQVWERAAPAGGGHQELQNIRGKKGGGIDPNGGSPTP